MGRVLGIVYRTNETRLIHKAGVTRTTVPTSAVILQASFLARCGITDISEKQTFKTQVFSCAESRVIAGLTRFGREYIGRGLSE